MLIGNVIKIQKVKTAISMGSLFKLNLVSNRQAEVLESLQSAAVLIIAYLYVNKLELQF